MIGDSLQRTRQGWGDVVIAIRILLVAVTLPQEIRSRARACRCN